MEQNIEVQNSSNASGNVLFRKLGVILSVFVFLLPVFFVPAESVSLYVGKIALLATGLVALFAVYLSTVLSTGTIELPKAKYLLPIGLFAVIAFISSAFSGNIVSSVAGSVFDLGTSGSILMLVFALFLTVVSVRSVGVVRKAITAFVYAAIALALYTLLGTFGASLLPAALASRMPLFLVGGAIDTAIVFGAGIILALCAVNMSELSRRMRYAFFGLMAFGLIFVGATNFTPVVVILGLVSLVFFVYILSWSVGKNQDGEGEVSSVRQFSFSSLVVLIVTIVIILGGTNISGYFSRMLRVQTAEIRPNFEATMNLATVAWKQNFALGVGPNNFADFWSANKPLEINQTQFWNVDFYSGSGFVPTMAITTGLLGLLVLLVFVVMYVRSGVRAMFAQANSGRSRYLATSTFLVSLYFWVMLFLYTPSITVLTLAFVFTGLFTATLVPQGTIGAWRVNIFSNPKTNFLSVLSIVVLLVLSVAGGYFVWERAIAATSFQQGVLQFQRTGDIALARNAAVRSINMVPSDIYWRGLTEISVADLGAVLGSIQNESQMTEAVRTQIQGLIANSVESARQATTLNSRNFQNWFALGRVYEILAGNGIEGALENARGAYAEAALRAPTNPSVPLALARLDVLAQDAESAKANIQKAISLKNNYTDAYFTLAQIEVASNNIRGAIASVEQASFLDPQNTGLFFQLGLLKYNARDWAGAILAFERAIALVPDYANARYFLGLAYEEAGRTSDAILQFEEIMKTNPDNAEVGLILTNLKAGKSPFAGAKPPVDSAPQSRETPPIEE